MHNMTILIILIACDFVLLLPIVSVLIEAKINRYRHQKTIVIAKHLLGFLISINGEIRTGKTSFMSGLSSVIQYIILELMDDLKRKVKSIFKDIDFHVFNEKLDYAFEEDESFSIDDLTMIMLDDYELNGNELHFNLIGHKKIKKLIHDYIEVYWIEKIRANYVQSKTPFYANVTATYSMELNLDWMKIHDAYKKGEFSLYKYMVFLVDELTDEAGASMFTEDPKDESGNKEFRRKFGQIFEETSWMITTKQDVLDEVKKFRNLTHSNLMIEEKVDQVGYRIFEKVVRSFYESYLTLYKLVFVLPKYLIQFLIHPIKTIFKQERATYAELEEDRFNRVGSYRNHINLIYYIEQFFMSIRLNKYKIVKLNRAEDVEKVTADKDQFNFYIPVVDCFGTYNTHFYASMLDELHRKSSYHASEVNPFKQKTFFTKQSPTSDQKGVDDFVF